MKTDNNNTNCVIDIETTGLDDQYHEICELAIVLLDCNLKPTKNIFHKVIRPNHMDRCDPQALKVNGFKKEKLLLGKSPGEVLEELDLFIEEHVKPGKQLVPLGHNYTFDKGFLRNFLGSYHDSDGKEVSLYDEWFFRRYRDTMHTAIFINDLAEMNGRLKVPFPKVSLKYLCSTMGIENPKAHTALSDALATLKCYEKMISWYLGSTPFSFGASDAV